MQIALIQNTLRYAALNHDKHDDEIVAAGYISSTAIAPIFYGEGTRTAVRSIMFEMRFRTSDVSTKTDANKVFQAFNGAIKGLNGWIRCNDIGTHEVYGSVCDVNEVSKENQLDSATEEDSTNTDEDSESSTTNPVVTSMGYNLAESRYIATSSPNVSSRAKISLDVRDMLKAETLSEVKNIYEKGKNAGKNNDPISISSFSKSSP